MTLKRLVRHIISAEPCAYAGDVYQVARPDRQSAVIEQNGQIIKQQIRVHLLLDDLAALLNDSALSVCSCFWQPGTSPQLMYQRRPAMILQENTGAVQEIYVEEALPLRRALLQESQDMTKLTKQQFLDEVHNRKLTIKVFDDEPANPI